MHLHRFRARQALALVALSLASLLVGCSSDEPGGDQAGTDTSETPSTGSQAAAEWLAGQLEDGLLTTSYESPAGSGKWVTTPDYGLSLDAYFALAGIDGFETEQEQILAAVEPEVAGYIGSGKDAYAGATGKVVAALQEADLDPTDWAGQDLLARLEGLVVPRGAEQGRAKDTWARTNEFGADYSNTIGQSWVVRALVGADSEAAEDTTTFLLAQQCQAGFFRLLMESSDFTCDTGDAAQSAPNVDATGFAVQALVSARSADVEADAAEQGITSACSWLVETQAEDGSFVDADSQQPNTNSTGIAADALVACGEDEAAERAAAYLEEHQVTEPEAGSKLADHAGAVAYDHAALQAAQAKGITRAVRYQWLRSTAQCVGALGVGSS